jgi:putative tryptophan/tyrosine transport system substrate-binding protein
MASQVEGRLMRRRDFLRLVGSSAIAWPIRALAADKGPRIAILTLLSVQDGGGRVAAFVAGLRELGYVEGRNLDIDYRYADGDTERLKTQARELAALLPTLAFAGEPTTARALKSEAPNLPIICPVLTDRLSDLFASYARPGGNVTGIATMLENMNGKVVELVLDVIPGTTRIGLLVNPVGANHDFIVDQVRAAADVRGLSTQVEEAQRPEELAPAIDRLVKSKAQAVLVAPNGMFINQRKSIIQLALAAKLPTFFQQRQDVEAGGFLSYGVNETEGSHRLAVYADKILKGAKPGDLPIEFPTQIELVINRKTARALGVTIPQPILARADDLVE